MHQNLTTLFSSTMLERTVMFLCTALPQQQAIVLRKLQILLCSFLRVRLWGHVWVTSPPPLQTSHKASLPLQARGLVNVIERQPRQVGGRAGSGRVGSGLDWGEGWSWGEKLALFTDSERHKRDDEGSWNYKKCSNDRRPQTSDIKYFTEIEKANEGESRMWHEEGNSHFIWLLGVINCQQVYSQMTKIVLLQWAEV